MALKFPLSSYLASVAMISALSGILARGTGYILKKVYDKVTVSMPFMLMSFNMSGSR